MASLIRESLSEYHFEVLRTVADAGRPVTFHDTTVVRLRGRSEFQELVERALLRLLVREGDLYTVEITARGMAELALRYG